jgi:DNA modification methylase
VTRKKAGKLPKASPALGEAAERAALAQAEQVVPAMVHRISLWPVNEMDLLDRNPRTHSDEQVREIAESMRAFGVMWPVIVDVTKRCIVAGNGRYLAAKVLGLRHLPVLEAAHLSETQLRAFIIADNKIATNAGWDNALLATELPALREAGVELGLMGFSDEELAEVLAGLDGAAPEEPKVDAPVPPRPAKPTTRVGDLWTLGNHRLLCGSATIAKDVARVMGGREADAVWTDPPYNVDYEGLMTPEVVKARKRRTDGKLVPNDSLSAREFTLLLQQSFKQMFAAMNPGAGIYVAHSDREGLAFRREFEGAGFHLSGCLIWRKNCLVLGRTDYQYQHEPILYGWKPGAGHSWYGGRDKTTMVELSDVPVMQVGDDSWQVTMGELTLLVTGKNVKVETLRGTVFHEAKPSRSPEHPTMKPVALITRMLKNSARIGDVVLDPFGGSGSTLIAAEGLGMKARLIELDPGYCDVIVERWQAASGKKAKRAAAGE